MKSNDLQGLRGIAVISVVLFHVKTKIVEKGFLGVDIFFVLSGYFMAHSMADKEINLKSTAQFYARRIKRLMPSYSLLLFFIIATIPFFLILSEFKEAYGELSNALAFILNFKYAYDYYSYFRKDDDLSSVVMHLWSLALEMQFYLVVPLIYKIINGSNDHRTRIMTVLILITGSLLAYCMPQTEQFRFYFLHNRLWQFVVGFLAHEIVLVLRAKDNESCHPSKNSLSIASILCSLSLLWILSGVYLPIDNHGVLRVFTCSLALFIIAISNLAPNPFLAMRWLVYMGDLSYILYLIHWPVIVFVHLISLTKAIGWQDACISLSISFILSIATHHLYEKPLQSRTIGTSMLISAVFYGISVCAITLDLPHRASYLYIDWCQTGNSTLHDAMIWNHNIRNDPFLHRPNDCVLQDEELSRWTDWKETTCVSKSNGSLEILVLGNSVSQSSFETVHSVLAGHYKTLRLFTKTDCELLGGGRHCSQEYLDAVHSIVAKMKPDIVLITELHGYLADAADNDRAKNFVEYLKKHSKAVMIDFPYFLPFHSEPSFGLSHQLAHGNTDLSAYALPEEVMSKEYSVLYSRIRELEGEKVILNDISMALCKNGTCYGYDSRTLRAYNNVNTHLNAIAYKLMRPFYEQSIGKALKLANE